MQYSENYHLNKPDLADQYNLLHWNENTDTIDNAMQDIRSGMDATMKATLLNFCYPIGSIYWSSNSTNPATLFGGTWTQIKDRFVWAKGDNDTVDSTGGAKTVTLATDNLPAHKHTVGAHTHGLGSHAHSFSGSASHSHYFTNGGMSLCINATQAIGTYEGFSGGGGLWGGAGKALGEISAATVTISGITSQATGCTDNSATFDSGSTGNGTEINKMPPYVVKYCWERTA